MELKAFQLAGAGLAATSGIPTFDGFTFDELVTSFGSTRVVTGPSPGKEMNIAEAAILIRGAVIACESKPMKRTSVNVKMNVATYEAPGSGSGGSGVEVAAPAFLAKGKYIIVADTRVRLINSVNNRVNI